MRLLHWGIRGNCWMGTVGSWGLRFWGRQWSCSDS